MGVVVPRIVDVDQFLAIVIANTNDAMTRKVKHYRSASVNLRFELGKGKTSSHNIVRFLVVAVCNGITSGLIKEFSALRSILSDTVA